MSFMNKNGLYEFKFTKEPHYHMPIDLHECAIVIHTDEIGINKEWVIWPADMHKEEMKAERFDISNATLGDVFNAAMHKDLWPTNVVEHKYDHMRIYMFLHRHEKLNDETLLKYTNIATGLPLRMDRVRKYYLEVNTKFNGYRTAMVEYDPMDGMWIALVKDLPGCGTQSKTYQGLLINIEDAIDEYIKAGRDEWNRTGITKNTD